MLPLVLAASLAAPAAASLAIRGDGIIRSPVNALSGSTPRLQPRQNAVEVQNQQQGARYVVEIEVGKPPQKVALILDTGSPVTWVNPTCANAPDPSDCSAFPRFDPQKSSSLKPTNDRHVPLVYGIGKATVQYVYETVTIGSAALKSQIIGIATESTKLPLGILGLSPPVHGKADYPYVLDTMVAQRLIKSRAFALDLRSVDDPTGSVIFGGIDTGKYIGTLAKLPMLSPENTPVGADRYYINLTGVGLTLPNGQAARSDPIEVPVFLDSGSTFSRLPPSIFQAISGAFSDAQYDPATGFSFLPCDVTRLDGTIDFYFGAAGKTATKAIRVPLRDFIWQVQGYCVLGVMAEDREPVLGDPFLRAAYVVFDQDNRNVHLAQAANCGSNLVAIGAGADAVPSSTGQCTARPTPSGSSGGANLDVTATRAPTNTFTGSRPTHIGLGPGPAEPRPSGSVDGAPGASNSAVGRGPAGVGFGAVAALAAATVLAWMF